MASWKGRKNYQIAEGLSEEEPWNKEPCFDRQNSAERLLKEKD